MPLKSLIIPQYLSSMVMNTSPMAGVYIQNILQMLYWTGTHTRGCLKRVTLRRKWCHTNIWRGRTFKGQLCFEAEGNKGSFIRNERFGLKNRQRTKRRGWLKPWPMSLSKARATETTEALSGCLITLSHFIITTQDVGRNLLIYLNHILTTFKPHFPQFN